MARGGARWQTAGVSVTGSRHQRDAAPCEDRFRIEIGADGRLVAIVSDGAGSAKRGAEGAALICAAIAEALLVAPIDLSDAAMSAAQVAEAVMIAREAIEAAAGAASLAVDDYHATLVGALALPGVGGLFFHIGDGAGLAIDDELDRVAVSRPANGEYLDTTYFVTQPDWRDHLRIEPFDANHRTILLMTDGVTELGFAAAPGGGQPHMPFFRPICGFLAANDRGVAETALAATLDSESARARTSDDKTLVWARLSIA